MTFQGTLGFVIYVFDWEPKYCLFVFVNVYYLPFHPELSSTDVTFIASYMCIFMCKIHLKHCYVKCVENDSRKKGNRKTHAKKHKAILVPIQRYQNSRHLLQNPRLPRNVMGFSNWAQTLTPKLFELRQPLEDIVHLIL